jgi:hypothetical protein
MADAKKCKPSVNVLHRKAHVEKQETKKQNTQRTYIHICTCNLALLEKTYLQTRLCTLNTSLHAFDPVQGFQVHHVV